MSPDRQAGLVFLVSALAVVTFMAVVDIMRAPSTITAPSLLEALDATRDAAVRAEIDRAFGNPPGAAPVRPEPLEARSAGRTDLVEGRLLFPVRGSDPTKLRDTFADARGKRRHNALDIMAARGTPVIAVDDGRVAKLFRSPAGGISVYQYDRDATRVYYYAHLDRYAEGLAEGAEVRRGDVVGFVGSTGNAPEHAPHLHFAIFALGDDKRWWKGTAINPYPLLKSP